MFSLPNWESDAKSYVTSRTPLELLLNCLTFFKKDAASFLKNSKMKSGRLYERVVPGSSLCVLTCLRFLVDHKALATV